MAVKRWSARAALSWGEWMAPTAEAAAATRSQSADRLNLPSMMCTSIAERMVAESR